MESYFRSIVNLFAPPVCNSCGATLPSGIKFMCPQCRWDLPLTEFWLDRDNKVAQKFWGLLPLEGACSYFMYRQGSNFQRAIHNLKYHGYWKTSVEFGEMFGARLAENEPFDSVDLIIPVPLHRRKLLQRGYNQSEYLAAGLSKAMGVPVEAEALFRNTNNSPQARAKYKHLRWDNVKGIFAVKHPERLEGKHLLLVDDVLTTGATICSCAQAIIDAEIDCKISIATLSVSEYELNKKVVYK